MAFWNLHKKPNFLWRFKIRHVYTFLSWQLPEMPRNLTAGRQHRAAASQTPWTRTHNFRWKNYCDSGWPDLDAGVVTCYRRYRQPSPPWRPCWLVWTEGLPAWNRYHWPQKPRPRILFSQPSWCVWLWLVQMVGTALQREIHFHFCSVKQCIKQQVLERLINKLKHKLI